MKIVVTHMSPDWDAITSVWLLRKYLPGWQEAEISFVPAGQRYKDTKFKPDPEDPNNPIELIGDDEIIHVDTGLTPLDHHQTQDQKVCAASRTWDYVQEQINKTGSPLSQNHTEAVSRIVKIIVEIDHFREVFWPDASSDRYEFTLYGVLEGWQMTHPDSDLGSATFGISCLDALVATFENRIWAETEIKEKGIAFETRYGKGMGFETINDTVLKLAQKMGYVLVIRKDPRKGYVRIKALPNNGESKGADLTLLYEQLSKIDPDATWFLHVSKKMLLNGTPKNPKMIPTKLTLDQIIKIVEKI